MENRGGGRGADIRSDSRYCAEEGRCNVPGEYVGENWGGRMRAGEG